MVELVHECLARNSSTYLCALPVFLRKKHKPESKEDPNPALPSFPLYNLVNHISEYVSVIVSNVESFAHKAPVAFNCRLRFNGSINYFVFKALSNLLSHCQMIETNFDNCVEPLHCVVVLRFFSWVLVEPS